MTDAQFRRILLELGLYTQKEIAQVLGLTPRTIIRHFKPKGAKGKTTPSLQTQRLVWMLQQHGIPPEFRR